MNLFDNDATEVEILQKQLWSTRLYLILLSTSLFVIVFYTTVITDVTTTIVSTPNETQFKSLIELNANQLICPCSQISIHHEKFFNVSTTFHQICSSDFIGTDWLRTLSFTSLLNQYYTRADIRRNMYAHFELLLSLSLYIIANNSKRFDQALSFRSIYRSTHDCSRWISCAKPDDYSCLQERYV